MDNDWRPNAITEVNWEERKSESGNEEQREQRSQTIFVCVWKTRNCLGDENLGKLFFSYRQIENLLTEKLSTLRLNLRPCQKTKLETFLIQCGKFCERCPKLPRNALLINFASVRAESAEIYELLVSRVTRSTAEKVNWNLWSEWWEVIDKHQLIFPITSTRVVIAPPSPSTEPDIESIISTMANSS